MVNRSHMLSQKRPSFNKNSPQIKNERTKGKTLFQFRCNEFIWVRFAKSQRSQDRHEWLPGCVDHSRPTTNPKIVEVFPWPPPGCVSDVWRGEGFYLNHLPTSYASFLKDSAGFVPQNCQNCPRCPNWLVRTSNLVHLKWVFLSPFTPGFSWKWTMIHLYSWGFFMYDFSICKCIFFREMMHLKGCKKSKCSNSPVGLSFKKKKVPLQYIEHSDVRKHILFLVGNAWIFHCYFWWKDGFSLWSLFQFVQGSSHATCKVVGNCVD